MQVSGVNCSLLCLYALLCVCGCVPVVTSCPFYNFSFKLVIIIFPFLVPRIGNGFVLPHGQKKKNRKKKEEMKKKRKKKQSSVASSLGHAPPVDEYTALSSQK